MILVMLIVQFFIPSSFPIKYIVRIKRRVLSSPLEPSSKYLNDSSTQDYLIPPHLNFQQQYFLYTRLNVFCLTRYCFSNACRIRQNKARFIPTFGHTRFPSLFNVSFPPVIKRSAFPKDLSSLHPKRSANRFAF